MAWRVKAHAAEGAGRARATAMLLGMMCAATAWGDVVSLNAVADAFVVSSSPNGNYGGAGALSVAAPALPKGEFQAVMRFDALAAKTAFDTSLGAGKWAVQSATLQLSAAFPNNPIFNAAGAGLFVVGWMQNDTWVEGTGMPNSPGAMGITFANLPSFLSAADQDLGTFAFDGSTTGAATYSLGLATGFVADVQAGGLVSLRLRAADSVVAYLFNSTNFGTPANRPVLTITGAAKCVADFNGSGAVTVQDIFDFLSAWFAGSARADVNHSGTVTVQDIFDFLSAWFAGCR